MDLRVEQIVREIKAGNTNINLNDYPPVQLEDLEDYVDINGPLLCNDGALYSRFELLSTGEIVLRERTVFDKATVAAEIGRLIQNWSAVMKLGGKVAIAEGDMVLDDMSVVKPNVWYVDRPLFRAMTNQQRTTIAAPNSSTFCVEVDNLYGTRSKRRELLEKARRYLTLSRCILLWLIDPIHKIMIVLRRDDTNPNGYTKDDDESWRDLSAAPALPGFILQHCSLDQCQNAAPGSSDSDDDIQLACINCHFHGTIDEMQVHVRNVHNYRRFI